VSVLDLRLIGDGLLLGAMLARVAEGIALGSAWRPGIYLGSAFLLIASELFVGRAR
jgi:hypothetical protein